MGAVVVVETDTEPSRILLVLCLDTGDLLLGGDAQFFRSEHDGRTVCVIGAHVEAIVATRLLEAYPDIGLHHLQHVAQMQWAVGVR